MPGRKYKIAIVEDHRGIAESIGEIINGESDMTYCGFATDINGGLDLIQKEKPDLVIVDISLKNNELGTTLIGEIRKYFTSIRILVYTMHDNVIHLDTALKAGANGYILKEESLDDLFIAVRGVLGGDTYVSEIMKKKYSDWIISRRSGESKDIVNILAPRELEIFSYIGDGVTTSEIAKVLGISVNTVNSHVNRIKDKLGFKTKSGLMKYAFNYLKETSDKKM